MLNCFFSGTASNVQEESNMSDDAYRMFLMQRALARTDAELFGHRQCYIEVAQRLAARLLSNA